ncbi:hypothetical protein GCM10023152_31190 [Agromyces bauzanensis]|uniref:Uncharacterized protein n=1 Tax=Agromyces bauzanensis TaxID=1308924 RepID=A0A917UMR4_9MICO|nr:hypothetical protein GCM10011372_03140 [Agromyces bauzanensis]
MLFSLYGWIQPTTNSAAREASELGLAAAAKEKQAVKHGSRVTPTSGAGAIVTEGGCRGHGASAPGFRSRTMYPMERRRDARTGTWASGCRSHAAQAVVVIPSLKPVDAG